MVAEHTGQRGRKNTLGRAPRSLTGSVEAFRRDVFAGDDNGLDRLVDRSRADGCRGAGGVGEHEQKTKLAGDEKNNWRARKTPLLLTINDGRFIFAKSAGNGTGDNLGFGIMANFEGADGSRRGKGKGG